MIASQADGTRRSLVGGHRHVALLVVALAQLTIALDATIVNLALPSIEFALGFPDTERHWVITAYTAVLGGMLLFGGRVADRLGPRRAFMIGLVGFGLASGAGALSPDLPTLAMARAMQGAFAALLAPTTLALLSLSFPDPRERGRAFAVFAAVAGGGGAVGLVLGGILVEHLGWRSCLSVNVPIVALITLGVRHLPADRPHGPGDRHWDLTGALLITVALVTTVAACSGTMPLGWAAGSLLGAAGALVAFVHRETRAPAPLLPMRILADRALVGCCLVLALAVAGMLGAFLTMTYFLQVVLGFTPLDAGLAFLPLSGALFAGAQVAGRVMRRIEARNLAVPGLLVAAGGMVLLTRLTPHSAYLSGVLPGQLLLGAGIGVVFTPVISLATGRAAPPNVGVTAAVVSTAQQLGGSVGLATLNALAARATASAEPVPSPGAQALVNGYTTATGLGAVAFVTAAAVCALLITPESISTRRTDVTSSPEKGRHP